MYLTNYADHRRIDEVWRRKDELNHLMRTWLVCFVECEKIKITEEEYQITMLTINSQMLESIVLSEHYQL